MTTGDREETRAKDTSEDDEQTAERRDEDAKERVDRELIELLNELRVAIPGVQVLFAFLLTIPCAQGFVKVMSFQRGIFATSLLCAALATVLLIAPSSYHRLLFREGEKLRLLLTANKLAIWGFAFLATAIVCAIFFIIDFVFGTTEALIAGAVALAAFAFFWYALPLSRRPKDGQSAR
ncbi:DUF6328 family protein [soil metagenome]